MVKMKKKINITCKSGELIPIDQIKIFQGDLKIITDEQLTKLKDSIVKYGFSFPIFVWGKNILDGHQRLKAITSLISDGYEIEDYSLPVVQIQAGSEQEAAEKLLLINSRYATMTQDGFDIFLADFSIDIDEFGPFLEIPEIDFDFADNQSFEGETDPDDIPDVQENAVSKTGDIWILGDHRLMCGDSTMIDHVNRLMNGDKAELIFYDPPFEIENIYSFIPVSKNNQRLIVFGNMFHFSAPVIEAHNKNWIPNYELIWDCVTSWYTPNRPLARHKKCYIFGDDPYWDFESAIIHDGKKREPKIVKNNRGKMNYKPLADSVHMRSIESFPTTSESGGHDHSKPVKWISAILNGINKHRIFDMFCGSGTTIISAQKTNRRCYAMEISPNYVDVAVRRWQDFTGNDAILESTGETFNSKNSP